MSQLYPNRQLSSHAMIIDEAKIAGASSLLRSLAYLSFPISYAYAGESDDESFVYAYLPLRLGVSCHHVPLYRYLWSPPT